tara:strand:+ start:8945 stop:10447 length:1503 start_codon:yes stop_codon:yes gene_type:complete
LSSNIIEVDVLIIGAGISGIGTAFHLQKHCPNKSYAIIEARGAVGGTWDLFRYPGIRSDSDMFTFGFNFKPWLSPKSISPGADIKAYISDAVDENGIREQIVFEHKVLAANWDSASAKWHTKVENVKTGECRAYSSRFFFSCAGYYNYEKGYTPDFAGVEDFTGNIIHPQNWPEELDYAGKKVIVIGSGATAVTLVPTLAKTSAHVTMLQRSPSYVLARPGQDAAANFMRHYLPNKVAYSLSRWKNILLGMLFYRMAKRRPETIKKIIRAEIVSVLGEDFPVDKHFNPSYQPWDQRLCLVPDGDLFSAIKNGSASVVTDHIERFTATGIKLRSGEELAADIIVTATGLSLEVLGSYVLSVDNKEFKAPNSYCYKGMMLSGLPNFAFVVGYTNASWTLKSDLVGKYMCRLISHMDKNQYDYCVPVLPEDEMPAEPLMDFSSSYVLRSLDKMPRQGKSKPWKLYQNYILDRISLGYKSVVDDSLFFSSIRSELPTKVVKNVS